MVTVFRKSLPKSKIKFSTPIELLCQRAAQQLDRVADNFLVNGVTSEGSWTYQDLDQKARAIAASLQSRGAIGDRALLLYPPGLEFIAAFFGCLLCRDNSRSGAAARRRSAEANFAEIDGDRQRCRSS